MVIINFFFSQFGDGTREGRRIPSMRSNFIFWIWDIDAIFKITGARVAYNKRPRTFQLFLSSPLNLFLLNLQFFSACSSGDSTGVTPEGQKALYDEVVKKRPQ